IGQLTDARSLMPLTAATTRRPRSAKRASVSCASAMRPPKAVNRTIARLCEKSAGEQRQSQRGTQRIEQCAVLRGARSVLAQRLANLARARCSHAALCVVKTQTRRIEF